MTRSSKADARHIHFKDGIREPIRQFPYRYQIPGEGVFPLKELFDLLERDNYADSIFLEWKRKWHPYLPPSKRRSAASPASSTAGTEARALPPPAGMQSI